MNDKIDLKHKTPHFAKPLLCAGRFISTKFNFKTKWQILNTKDLAMN